MKIKLLIVEDDERELDICRSSVKRYQVQKERQIELVECKTLEDAKQKLDSSFDGAIIDLNLGTDGYTGNEVIEIIHKSFRIPIRILTGTPLNAIVHANSIIVHTRGEIEYVALFDMFFDIYNTGLTKILGGRGDIEQVMHRVFWEHLLPHLDGWKTHVSNGKNTEKSLLRFTINHLLELLDDELDNCLPEEMYICPPVSKQIRTGSIVKAKSADEFYVVLSPACDLAYHNGRMKTDRIQICVIENRDSGILGSTRNELSDPKKSKNAEKVLKDLANNSRMYYYHYLPRTNTFEGGLINFRKVIAYSYEEFEGLFNTPLVQISAAFTKDIVARFSSYYARQGQPDFDSDALVEDLKKLDNNGKKGR